jgi:hypothetical protein
MSAKTKYIFDDQDKCRLSLWETGLVLLFLPMYGRPDRELNKDAAADPSNAG